MSECNHCWHFTGNGLTSNPMQYQHICCHCGELRNEHEVIYTLDGEHGEFLRTIPLNERRSMQPKPQTMEEISQELNIWLAERGVSLQIVAVGKRTGQPCAIDDFLPVSHDATVTLVKVQK